MSKPRIGLLLSGNGVYDGTEIQEAVFALLAIVEMGGELVPISIDKDQHHVINHITGEEMSEQRNMLVESARISRGQITEINAISPSELDALVIPGGFGNAKNFTSWAFKGPEGDILPEVKLLLVNLFNVGKPIVALCVSPVVVAKALEGTTYHPEMTLGSDQEPSPYSISDFNAGIEAIGAIAHMKTVHEIQVDHVHRLITAPCYMMEASPLEIRNNIKQAIDALKVMLEGSPQ